MIGSAQAAWDFLNEESAFKGKDKSVRPIDALRKGRVDAIVAAAHSILETYC